MLLQQTASARNHQHVLIVHHTHSKTHTEESDSMYGMNRLSLSFISLVLVVTGVTESPHSFFFFFSFFFQGDAFPAGSSPFLSGYPGPSSLTSDPAAYRSANPSGLQMAQVWASHAHEGKSPVSSTNISLSPFFFLFLSSFSVSVHNSDA